jgi:hypothetical protein
MRGARRWFTSRAAGPNKMARRFVPAFVDRGARR